MIRSRWSGYMLGAFLVASLGAPEVHAQGTSGKAVAEALFRDAKQLMESGDVNGACPKFAESLKLDSTLGTLLFLGACHEQQGRTASAWSEFSSALPWAERSAQADRIVFAQKHLAALENKLSIVVLSAPAIPGLQLRVDEGLLSAAAVGTPLPLDPGQHTIEASAPDRVAWHTSITVPAEPGRMTVEIPALDAAPPPPPQPTASTQSTEQPAPLPPPDDSGRRAGLWTGVGVAGVGVAVGTIFGVLALSQSSSAKTLCPTQNGVPTCSGNGMDDISGAKTDATISTIGFGVGLAGAVVAGYFIVRGATETKPAATTGSLLKSVAVTPDVAPHQAGLFLRAGF